MAETAESIEARVSRVEERTDNFKNQFDSLDRRIAQLESSTNSRFDQVDQRISKLEANMNDRFNQMEKRFNQMENRFNQMEKRMDHMETEFLKANRWMMYLLVATLATVLLTLFQTL